MSSILKTDALLKTIKRRAFIPSSQETFSEEDFLEMATEEVNLGLVPLIQKMHEEHLVYSEDIPLSVDVRKYPIPSRSHGNKLRDVFLVDSNGNLFEMARYSLGEIAEFSSTTSYINNRGFYLENNNIVLTNFEVSQNYSLRVFFYLRPNKLVSESRGTSIQGMVASIEPDYQSPLSGSITSSTPGTQTSIYSMSHGLSSGNLITISGADATPSINGTFSVSVVDSDNFTIDATTSAPATTGAWVRVVNAVVFNLDSVPSNFSDSLVFDFVQNISPNKIITYDVRVNKIDQTLKTISFLAADVVEVTNGSYITIAEETIVPNIPTELHPILAQRVAIACLEAMGDEQNKQSAERKLKQMEDNANTFLDNRVEGAQVKIKSKSSTLVSTLNQYAKRNRRW